MRRITVALGIVLVSASPARAQNCVTINGLTRCAQPWQIYDTVVRSTSVPVLDLRQTWNSLTTTFTGLKLNITDTNSATASLLLDLQVAGVSKFSVSKAGGQTHVVSGLAGTSTTGLNGEILNNPTLSTAGVPVQMSPPAAWCGHVWNTSADETSCFWLENLPATAATPTATFKMGYSRNGGAATYPFTVTNTGLVSPLGDVVPQTGGTQDFGTASAQWRQLFLSLNLKIANVLLLTATAPTVTSAGTSPAMAGGNGTATFRVNVGTGGVATTIVMAMPTATTGWNCLGSNLTAAAANRNPTGVLLEQSSTTTAVTMQYQTVATGVALAFAASDIVLMTCLAY